jgi:Tfp pilus assembly protein PilX
MVVDMKHKHKKLHQNQQGLVSITVVMILMGILVLIGTSFGLLMRREQRQVLDRQLSTQAFYAAESGVHDVAAKLSTINSDITDCNDTRIKGGDANKLDTTTNIEYTCVLVDRSPDQLVYDPISTENSTVVKLETENIPIRRIDISWQDASDGGTGTSFATNNTHLLPQNGVAGTYTSATGTGILRTTVMPVRNPANVNRDTLISDARTYFLYPKTGTANQTPNTASYAANANFIDGNCNASHPNKTTHPRYCNARIDNIQNSNNGIVYLRLKAIYRPVAVTVKIYDATLIQRNILNAQAVIDSTGKAQDVLRRIQVRVPIKGGSLQPEFAVESMDTICKRLSFVQPGSPAIIDLPQASDTDWRLIDYNRDIDSVVCNPERP